MGRRHRLAAGAEPLRQPHLLVHGRFEHGLQPGLYQERAVDLARPDLRLLRVTKMMFVRTLMLGAAVAALGVSTGAQAQALAQTQRPDRPEPAPVQASERPIAPATVQPERIILNLTADPAHQMAVTWRTAPGLDGQVEFAEAQDGPDFIASAVRVASTTDHAVLAVREAADFRAAYHSAVMKGLKPATVYVYRVGSGGAWSEWLQFRTAAATPEA